MGDDDRMRGGTAAPSRGRRLLALALVAAAAVLLFAGWYAGRPTVAPVAAAAPGIGPMQPLFGNVDVAATPVAPPARQQLIDTYRLAAHTLCSYEQASLYPPGSRPMAQNADQAYPNRPVLESHPMRLDGGGTDARVIVQTAQSRVHMAAGESVALSLRAVDPQGIPQPLVVTRAVAAGIGYGAARPNAPMSVPFVDDGTGTYASVLAPAQTALAGFDGTIRTQVDYSVDGKTGKVAFDVIYSPAVPAVWSGPVRAANENGSLNFYLPADVREAGRYIVSGRVDDAQGVPFALLTFNDLLPAGPNEIKLSAFGKLLRDGAPAQPLTLRDVDGYLLRENVDPDRALMPRLEGIVATSGRYPADSFSDAPYDGAERTRYLAEFGRDLARARNALVRDDPHAALPAPGCPPVGAQPAR